MGQTADTKRYQKTAKGRESVRRYRRKRYQTNPVARAKKLATIYAYRQTEKGKMARRAQTAVYKAIGQGRLVRQPCETCGNRKSEAHHHDYSQPLDVSWFCRVHHAEVHHRTA